MQASHRIGLYRLSRGLSNRDPFAGDQIFSVLLPLQLTNRLSARNLKRIPQGELENFLA